MFTRGVRDSYYDECLRWIVPNDIVDKHLQELGYEDDTSSVSLIKYLRLYAYELHKQQQGMCGTSRWKAAKSVSKAMKNLDETGIVVTCCRHQITQKAVNMFRGEV